MKEIGIKGGELIAVNTDAQDLLYANADQKILIGKELTQGLGAGSNPKIGEEAAKESASEIKRKLSGICSISSRVSLLTISRSLTKVSLLLRFNFISLS